MDTLGKPRNLHKSKRTLNRKKKSKMTARTHLEN